MYKFYLSYWSGGYTTRYNRSQKPSSFLIDMTKLCTFLLKKHYGRVTLITDNYGKEFLKDCYFDEIRTDLNDLDDLLGDKITYNWALGKLYAYKKLAEQNEPFLHVDYDVFMFKPLPEYTHNQQILVQSDERVPCFRSAEHFLNDYGLNLFEEYVEHRHEFPKPIFDGELAGYNVGIFGGTNCKFIKQYAEKAINFTLDPKTHRLYRALRQNNEAAPALVTEQYYLAILAKKYNVPVSCLLPGPTLPECDEQATKLGYVHLCEKKQKPETRDLVRKLLKDAETIVNNKKEHHVKNLQTKFYGNFT